jgi:hypothetical protein
VPSSTFGPGARPSLLSFGPTLELLSASAREAAGVEDFSAGVSLSSVEVVEIGLIAAEAIASLAPTEFSSLAFSSSLSESLRMMTLPSPGGLGRRG